MMSSWALASIVAIIGAAPSFWVWLSILSA